MKTSQRILAPILILATLLIASPALAKALVGRDLSFDQHIAQLRKKVEPNPASPQCLLTVHGVGYKLQQAGKP